MGLIADAYARIQKALFPPGKLFNLEPSSFLSRVLLGSGDEAARIDQRAMDLITESDPQQATTGELLPDFERILELSSTGTEAERQARVAARLVRRQRCRPVDYQTALAPILGQAIADVVVIERDRADAVAMADDREIYRFFIYRDPTDPGSYDIDDAQAMVDTMKQSHTVGHVIESDDFLCDDTYSLCDRDILGV